MSWLLVSCCGGLTPASSSAPTQLLACSHPEKWGRELEGKKWENPVGWDKDSLVSEGEKEEKKKKQKNMMQRQSLTTTHQKTNVSLWAATALEKKTFLFSCRAWCHMVWNISLVVWGQLPWLCPFPSCPAPAYLLKGQSGKQRWPWHCASTAQLLLKPWCYQHCFGHRFKAQHCMSYCEENELHPKQTPHSHSHSDSLGNTQEPSGRVSLVL